MNGIKLLLLLVASAQVEAGTERDFGWAVNKDGVLEYIVQINPDKLRAMEQRSALFPDGRENTSDIPRELVGRATRVVTRIGTAVLPREPSLQELERTFPRLFEQPNPNATAILGPGRLQDLEPPALNIQGQGSAPLYPAVPNALAGSQGQVGSLNDDRFGQGANSLREDLKERLTDALPDPSLLAQNFNNQSGTGSFLNDTRGAPVAGSKFNSTALPANPATNPASLPAKIPDIPSMTGANQAAVSNRSLGLGNGTGNATSPLTYPDSRFTPPSLNTTTSLPQQRTPSPNFGTSPALAGRPSNDWNAHVNPAPSINPGASSYSSNISQPRDNYNYGGSPNYPTDYTSQNPTHVAMGNSTTFSQPNGVSQQGTIQPGAIRSSIQTAGGNGSLTKQMEDALAVYDKLDKNKDGQLTSNEYPPNNVDGILLTLFVVSLLVNLYLGHLIRKLLMRYRLVLTNVRSQAAYT